MTGQMRVKVEVGKKAQSVLTSEVDQFCADYAWLVFPCCSDTVS